MDIHERRGHDREFNLNAMIWQVTRMRACLDNPEPWRRMVSEFPELIDVTSLTQQEVVRLYRVYVEEWVRTRMPYVHTVWRGVRAGRSPYA